MRNKAIFIDKDGTLIRDIPYNIDTNKIELLPGVVEGLKLLQKLGYKLICVSNQSGVARGLFEEKELQQAFDHLQNLLLEQGVQLDDFYYCPHHPEGTVVGYAAICHCRKPSPGMLISAAGELNISLKHSWMIGDILNDIEAGKRANCKTILINNGNETEWVTNDQRVPDFMVDTFYDAAQIIYQLDTHMHRPKIKGVMNL